MITWKKRNSLKENTEKEVKVSYLVKCDNEAHKLTREYPTIGQARRFIKEDRELFTDPNRRKIWNPYNLSSEELDAFWDSILDNDVKLFKVTHVIDYKEIPIEDQKELF